MRNEYDKNGFLRPECERAWRMMRPEGFMENPFIGMDGKDYHSNEALRLANEEYKRRMYVDIPIKIINEPIILKERYINYPILK